MSAYVDGLQAPLGGTRITVLTSWRSTASHREPHILTRISSDPKGRAYRHPIGDTPIDLAHAQAAAALWASTYPDHVASYSHLVVPPRSPDAYR